MKRFYLITSLVLVVLVIFVIQAQAATLKWIVYYGDKLKADDINDVDWAIVDQDVDPRPLKNGRTKFIAYVSVGEAEDYRDYWAKVKSSSMLVEKNINWKGAHLVDIRSQEWRDVLFGHTLKKVVDKGFDGVFLDTIDTAIYLEDKDAKTFAGSKKALVELVKLIRQKHPDLIIVPNNGLEVLSEYAGDVDAVLVEDLYTHYDFEKKMSVQTQASVMAEKEKFLDEFISHYKKPVLNLLYETSSQSKLAQFAITRSRQKGYLWYLTTVDLMKIGMVNP